MTVRKKTRRSARSAFTLIEVMIVVTIIGVVMNIAAPNIVRARERARARACIKNLKIIEGAKEQWALDTRAGASSAAPAWTALVPTYLKAQPVCASGGTYAVGGVAVRPTCGTSGGPFSHVLP